MSPFLNQNGIRTFGHSQAHGKAARGPVAADPAAPFRAEPRYRTNNRRIRMIIAGQECNFILSNVSTNGAAGSCDHVLQTEQRVRLVFEGREEIVGIVRWTRDTMAGIQFVEPLPQHLVHGGNSTALPERAPRYKISRSAKIAGDFAMADAIIRNVSSRGMLVETQQPLRVGQDVEVRCGRLLPLQGQVRWVNGGQAGILLALPISLDEFEQQTADAVI